MIVTINFDTKEIIFDHNVSLHDLGTYMNDYFPEDVWDDFKFVIYGSIDEDEDLGGEFRISYGDDPT